MSRNGYVPKWLCPETGMSRNGYVPKWLCPETVMSRNGYVPKCPTFVGMNNVHRMNDFVAVRHLKVMKLQCFVDKPAAIFFWVNRNMWCRLAND